MQNSSETAGNNRRRECGEVTDFSQRAGQFFRQAERQYQPLFDTQYEVECCGKVFPLVTGYEKRDPRYLFGIKSSISRDSICGELCFFDCCENLTEDAFTQYLELFRKIQDERVPSNDPSHDYTLISFVLCTDQVDRRLQRKIKRSEDYRQYKNDRYGWSALRICVVDLSTNQYYCNAMGKGILECLTRDATSSQEKKRFWPF